MYTVYAYEKNVEDEFNWLTIPSKFYILSYPGEYTEFVTKNEYCISMQVHVGPCRSIHWGPFHRGFLLPLRSICWILVFCDRCGSGWTWKALGEMLLLNIRNFGLQGSNSQHVSTSVADLDIMDHHGAKIMWHTHIMKHIEISWNINISGQWLCIFPAYNNLLVLYTCIS